MKSAPVVTPKRSPSPQLLLKRSPSNFFSHVTLTDSCHLHIVVSHCYRKILLPAPPSDNPESPTASGSRALLLGRAIKGMVGTQEFAGEPWTCYTRTRLDG